MLSQNNPWQSDGQSRQCHETYQSLRGQFKGDLLQVCDPGYEEARKIWNGMVARRPGLIARCVDENDVRTAIRIANDTGTVLSIYPHLSPTDTAARLIRRVRFEEMECTACGERFQTARIPAL